jgi:hypothetical protein
MKNDVFKGPAVDTLDIHENIVVVIAQIFENGSRNKGTQLSTITNKNGFVGIAHSGATQTQNPEKDCPSLPSAK